MHEAAAIPSWVLLAYLISGVCFILALRGLSSPDSSRRGNLIGMAGMAMMLFLILASGAVIPWWGIVALTLVWIAALVQGTRWFMTRPGRVVALAVGMLVLWLVVLYGGAVLLDWGR